MVRKLIIGLFLFSIAVLSYDSLPYFHFSVYRPLSMFSMFAVLVFAVVYRVPVQNGRLFFAGLRDVQHRAFLGRIHRLRGRGQQLQACDYGAVRAIDVPNVGLYCKRDERGSRVGRLDREKRAGRVHPADRGRLSSTDGRVVRPQRVFQGFHRVVLGEGVQGQDSDAVGRAVLGRHPHAERRAADAVPAQAGLSLAIAAPDRHRGAHGAVVLGLRVQRAADRAAHLRARHEEEPRENDAPAWRHASPSSRSSFRFLLEALHVSGYFTDRFQFNFSHMVKADNSFFIRVFFPAIGFLEFAQHPIFGVGGGFYYRDFAGLLLKHFSDGLAFTEVSDLVFNRPEMATSRNLLAKVFAEEGLVGAILLIGFMATVLRSAGANPYAKFAFALCVSLVMNFDSYSFVNFWLLIGFIRGGFFDGLPAVREVGMEMQSMKGMKRIA